MKLFTQAEIMTELLKAREKFPAFPGDPVHAAAVVAEESGELVQAALQRVYEGGSVESMRKEALHTIVTAIRFLEECEEARDKGSLPKNNNVIACYPRDEEAARKIAECQEAITNGNMIAKQMLKEARLINEYANSFKY